MEALAPVIKAVVAAAVPALVAVIVALAARYDIVVDADALEVLISGVVVAVLTGAGVYVAPANRPAKGETPAP